MSKVIASAAAALVIVFALSGCITIQLPAGSGENQSSGSIIECGKAASITQPGTYTLTGRCPDVTITTNDTTVTGDELVNVEISGDRVTVAASEATTIVVNGNSNIVEIGALSDAQVTGDRNSVHTAGALDRAVVNGNDNKVAADGGVVAVFDNGQRSEIG